MRDDVEFDVGTSPLPPGTVMIEASAGTGKTYALVGLWLRLLLEEGLRPDRILVVTYTEAATAELRDRIYRMLVEAGHACGEGGSDDPFLSQLLDRCRRVDPSLGDALARVRAAREGFDEAPIGTIHSFCHRVLRTRAFETGGWFDCELAPDSGTAHRELVSDWWTSELTTAPPVLVAWATKFQLMPAHLLDLLEELVRRPEIPRLGRRGDIRGLRQAAVDATETIRDLWPQHDTELRPFLLDTESWTRKRAKGLADFRRQCRALVSCLDGWGDCDAWTTALPEFSYGKILEFAAPPETSLARHPFWSHVEALARSADAWVHTWPMAFLDWAERELPRRRKVLRRISFNDLLTQLAGALGAEAGPRLGALIGGEYDAVMVDEFQDTDPVQWDIFRRLFSSTAHRLFLVGDPKQAIYGFRGADVFTYLAAARVAARRYTLNVNWRAGGELVRTLNRFWQGSAQPFVVPEIQFSPTRPAPANEKVRLVDADSSASPLRAWAWPKGEKWTRDEGVRRLADGVASEAQQLLNGSTSLDSRILRPGDIAVLGESRRQLEAVAAALRRRRIPVVLPTRQGVFTTLEAAEWHRFLAALRQPDRERYLRGALAGDLVGLDAATLDQLSHDPEAWGGWLQKVWEWARTWELHGPFALLRSVIRDSAAIERWMACDDGERRLTNYLQLAELLQWTAAERALGPSSQLRWLAVQRGNRREGVDDQVVRLERDDDAVRLLTVHGSKGLEFPVVFCPFVSKAATPSKRDAGRESVICHPLEGGGGAVWDLGSEDWEAHLHASRIERLAENVRLLYVALTRASQRAYFAWMPDNPPSTALNWLLTAGESPNPSRWLLNEQVREKKDRDVDLERDQFEVRARDAGILVAEIPRTPVLPWSPPGQALRELAPRQFHRAISDVWKVASFSWLTAGEHEAPADRDSSSDAPPVDDLGNEVAAELSPDPGTIHAFPRGREAGTCLHRILELWLRGDLESEPPLSTIEDTLADFSLSEEYSAPIGVILHELARSPLSDGFGPVTLAGTSLAERLVELEFCLPLRRVTATGLAALLERHHGELPPGFPACVADLGFAPVEGALRGFIDLVFRSHGKFWVMDWKSNWLGPGGHAYAAAALESEMKARLYPLQALLYALAVDRWLKLRLPDYDYARDFGGIHYVFLRGIDATVPRRGIHSWLPSADLMADLQEYLLDFTDREGCR